MGTKRRFVDLDFGGNQIIDVVLEKLAADPATPASGRFWYNETAGEIKYADETGIQTVANLENVLTTALNEFAKPTGDMDFNTQKLTNVADGVDAADALNKGQVDTAIAAAVASMSAGLEYKGLFDASIGTYDVMTDAGHGDFYKVSVAGVIGALDFQVGDMIIVNKAVTGVPVEADIDKIDNTESPDILREGTLDNDTVIMSGGKVVVTANAFRNNNKVVMPFGDGTAKTFTLNHNLGTEDVQVEIVDNTGTGDTVEAYVERTDADNITVDFGTGSAAPTVDEFKAVIIG